MAEVSDRLRHWIISQAADRLVTEGGPTEEASSPPAAEDQNSPLAQQHPQEVDHPDFLQDKQQQIERGGGEDLTTATNPRPAADHDGKDAEAYGISLEHLRRHNRPLSGSTIGDSSTAPTALGNSSVTYKGRSSGRLQQAHTTQADFETPTLSRANQARHTSNSSTDYEATAATTTLGDPSKETNVALTNKILEGRTTQNPNLFPSPVDGPAEASGGLPDSTGALKRTISSPAIDDLNPQTRTACPSSEATNLPPAYARPRSEVGLPPLPLRGNQNTREDVGNDGGDEKEAAQRSIFRPLPRRRSVSRGRSRERPISAQDYLSYARKEFMRFG